MTTKPAKPRSRSKRVPASAPDASRPWAIYAGNGDYLGAFTYTPAQLSQHFPLARLLRVRGADVVQLS